MPQYHSTILGQGKSTTQNQEDIGTVPQYNSTTMPQY